jgi:nicotinamide riboside transporter PnuC
MKEIFENDDDILGMVRKEGLLKPSANFTSRVMQYIEEGKELNIAYQPLLSRKAWMVIISGGLLLILICWQVLAQSADDTNGSAVLDTLSGYINSIDFSLKFDANALMIITLAMISMGILLGLDLWFSNNRRDTAS